MRILVAPQEFKGSLTASEAAGAIADGLRRGLPGAEIDEAPMSDGGAGLVEALVAARDGSIVESDVRDPLMRPVRARWGVLDDGTAAIEMAAASGLVLVAPAERQPLAATTYGTGEVIRAALDRGGPEIIVGVGGSASTDAGAGALRALGARLRDAAGGELPPGGGALGRLERLDLSRLDARLRRTRLRVAADVENTLCGAEGAAAVYGRQKGATAADIDVLERGLRTFANVAAREAGIDLLSLRGGGAAGGLASGLAVAGATIERGFALIAEVVGLARRIAGADVIVTGEGRLDRQTAFGKTAAGVAGLARRHGKHVIAIAGVVDEPAPNQDMFDRVIAAAPAGTSVEVAMRDARSLLVDAAERVGRELRAR